jgi:hypothetical protein
MIAQTPQNDCYMSQDAMGWLDYKMVTIAVLNINVMQGC